MESLERIALTLGQRATDAGAGDHRIDVGGGRRAHAAAHQLTPGLGGEIGDDVGICPINPDHAVAGPLQ